MEGYNAYSTGVIENLALDDTPPVVEADKEKPLMYADYVVSRQEAWRTQRKEPYTEFSQAIDIPEGVSARLLDLVVTSLPPYITDEIKNTLVEKHPRPVVAVGVLADRRLFSTVDEIDIPVIDIPETITEKEQIEAYRIGLTVLDEIATDTLAQEVIEALGQKNSWFKPVASILRGLNSTRQAYKKGLVEMSKIFGDSESLEEFRQSLVLAMLTGETDILNVQLRLMGYQDISELAIKIGETAEYSDVLMKFLDKIGHTRGAHSLAGGIVSFAYPGVINMPLAHMLPASVNMLGTVYSFNRLIVGADKLAISMINLLALAFNGYFSMKPAISIPNALVHEVCHYLGQDFDHQGLRRVKRIGDEHNDRVSSS